MSSPHDKPSGDAGHAPAPRKAGTDPDLALGDTLASAGKSQPEGKPAATTTLRSDDRATHVEFVAEPEDAPRSSTGTIPPHIAGTLAPSGKSPIIEDELPRGAEIGRYIVLSCLGAGGMGVVYAAYDPELDRKVAIKLLRPDADGTMQSGQARLRLLREAQAMARLSHPQVISVYDVGTLRDQVFIAMEFIDGTTLTGWLKDQQRTQSEIIEVFTLSGQGLAAAHVAGLIHRDFKPDNVLVGKDGKVRVTDFGLARSTSQREDGTGKNLLATSADPASSQALNLHLTRTGAMMGTPRYMAPEQYEGKPTDPRTDQFSFCVALYEALYNTAPFEGDTLASLGLNVVSGRVCSPPPDAKVPTWMRQVLLRGLSVNPDDRYPSMEVLLSTINRQRRGSGRVILATAAIVSLALLGNVGYEVWQRRKDSLCSGSERKLVGIWEPARKPQLHNALLSTKKPYAEEVWQRVEQALDSYTKDWANMRTEACLATVRSNQSKTVLDLRMRCLDERLDEIAAFTGVLATADENTLERASTVVREFEPLSQCADVEALKAPPPLPEDPVKRAKVEKLLQQLAEVRAEERIGRYRAVLAKATLLAEEATTLRFLPVVAEALYMLGQVQEQAGLGKQAEKTYVRAAAAGMKSNKEALVAQTLIHLTELTGYRLRHPEKAESWDMLADSAIEALRDSGPLKAQLLQSRCRVAMGLDDFERAGRYCQQALELREKLNNSSSENQEVARVLHSMGSLRRRQGKPDEALKYYHEELRIQQKVLGEVHPDIASALRGIGLVLRDQTRFREANEYFVRALEIVQKSLGPDHVRTSDFHLLVGINALFQNKVSDAERHLQRSMEIRDAAPEGDLDRRAEARYFLSEVLYRQARYKEALVLNKTGLSLREKDPEPREDKKAYNLHGIGMNLLALGELHEAQSYFERTLSIRKNLPPRLMRDNLNQLAETQFYLAQTLWAIGDKAQRKVAMGYAREAQGNYIKWGNRPDNLLAAVTAWLAAPTAKPQVRKPPPEPPQTPHPEMAPGGPAAPATGETPPPAEGTVMPEHSRETELVE